VEPGEVELGELELGELEPGDVEFVSLRRGEVLFSFLSLSEFVEFTLLRSLSGLAPGVLGVVLGEVTPGELGVVLPGCAPGVVAPGYVDPGVEELPAPGVPGEVLGVWPHVKELRQTPRAGTSKKASLFFILLGSL
jgi:hypothetical protein